MLDIDNIRVIVFREQFLPLPPSPQGVPMRLIISLIIFAVFAYLGFGIGQSHHAWKWYAGIASVILYLMLNAGKQAMADEKGPLPFYIHLILGALEALDGFALGIFIGTFR